MYVHACKIEFIHTGYSAQRGQALYVLVEWVLYPDHYVALIFNFHLTQELVRRQYATCVIARPDPTR